MAGANNRNDDGVDDGDDGAALLCSASPTLVTQLSDLHCEQQSNSR